MSRRINKVNQVIQKELAKLIQEEFSNDLITITFVETALDLKSAKVWFTAFKNEKEATKKLSKKAYELQRLLGSKLFIKNIPKLSFHLDKSNERVAKIEKILG